MRDRGPFARTRPTTFGRSLPVAIGAAASLLLSGLAGCYEHVVHASSTAPQIKETYAPNVQEEGPSWIDQFMWGDPPKGQDPVKYYRQKNSFGLRQ